MTATPTWQHADLAVDGVGIHYARAGTAGKPPVVLLHGFSDSGAVWAPLARDLTADYDLVAIDTVGHGRSGPPGPDFSRARFVTDTLAVMDALELAQATLLGHSMGAGTAANVAAQAPDRVRALVLEDPGLRDAPAPMPPDDRGIGSPHWIDLLMRFREQDNAARLAAARAEHPNWSDDELLPWAEAKARFSLEALPQLRAPQQPAPWRDTYRRIACPILLITGDPARGAIVTPAIAAEVAAMTPATQVAHIPGTSHNIRRDDYPAFLAAVRAFLAAH